MNRKQMSTMQKLFSLLSVLFFMISCTPKPISLSNTKQVGSAVVTGTVKHYVLGRIEMKDFTVRVKSENYDTDEIGFSVRPSESKVETTSIPGVVLYIDLKKGQDINSQSIPETFVPNIEDNNVVNAQYDSVITSTPDGQKITILISSIYNYKFDENKTYLPSKELPYVIEAKLKRY